MSFSPIFSSKGVALNKYAVSTIAKRDREMLNLGKKKKDTDFFAERIVQLKELRDTVEASEIEFYKMLNLKSTSGKEAIKELQRRIESIDKDNGLNNLVDNNKYKILSQIEEYFITISSDTVVTKINDYLEKEDVVGDIWDEDDVFAHIIGILNKKLKGKSHDKNTYFINNSERGLKRYLEATLITTTEGTKKVSLKLKDDKKLPKELKNKLLKITRETEKEVNELTTEGLKKELRAIIEKTLSPNAKRYFDYRFDQVYEQYAIQKNEAVVKGFLGELRNDIILDMLMGRPGATAPTGKIQEVISGQAINIDSVINGFGFQVKNYSISKAGETTFSKSMKASNFIIDRARVPLSDALMELFGTYQFNQPTDDADGGYMKIYDNLEKTLYNSADYFKAYIDNIIRVSNTFSAKDNIFGLFADSRLYFNTFFVIKDKYVPASAIINGVIKGLLDAENEENTMSFNFTSIYAEAAGVGKEEENSDGRTTWGEYRNDLEKVNLTFNELSEKVSIKYEVKISVQKILDSAYDYI